jgi:hypothetical protein
MENRKEAAPLLFPYLCILIVSAFISYDFCFMMLLVNSPWPFDVSSFRFAISWWVYYFLTWRFLEFILALVACPC